MSTRLLGRSRRPLIFLVARSGPPDCTATIVFLALLTRFCRRPWEIRCLPFLASRFDLPEASTPAVVLCVDWSSFLKFFETIPLELNSHREICADERELLESFFAWLTAGHHKLGVFDHWCSGKWDRLLRFLQKSSGEQIWVECPEFYSVTPPEWAQKRGLLTRCKVGSRVNTLAKLVGPGLAEDPYAWELGQELLRIEMGLESPINVEIQNALRGFAISTGTGIWSDEFEEFLTHCTTLLAEKRALSTDVRMFDWRDLYSRKQQKFRAAISGARDIGDGIFEICEPVISGYDKVCPDIPNIEDLFVDLTLSRNAKAIVGTMADEHVCDELGCVIYTMEDTFSLQEELSSIGITHSAPTDAADPKWLTRVSLKDRDTAMGVLRIALQSAAIAD